MFPDSPLKSPKHRLFFTHPPAILSLNRRTINSHYSMIYHWRASLWHAARDAANRYGIITSTVITSPNMNSSLRPASNSTVWSLPAQSSALLAIVRFPLFSSFVPLPRHSSSFPLLVPYPTFSSFVLLSWLTFALTLSSFILLPPPRSSSSPLVRRPPPPSWMFILLPSLA